MLNAFGDFTLANVLKNNTSQPPYVQLLSLTNKARAHREFVKTRVSRPSSSTPSSARSSSTGRRR
jgi:hypothetical protein